MKPELLDISGVKILLTTAEAERLQELLRKASAQLALGTIISTGTDGLIESFAPNAGMSWEFVFFLQNLMIMQRLYLMDDFLRRNGVLNDSK